MTIFIHLLIAFFTTFGDPGTGPNNNDTPPPPPPPDTEIIIEDIQI